MKILKTLKNSLIPGYQNSFHPYLLRAPALATAVAALLLLQVAVNIQGQSGQLLGVSSSIESDRLTELTNQVRRQQGLETLTPSPKLQSAARAKAQDMVDRGYWGHYAPDGTGPWAFIRDSEYAYRFAGENLAKDFYTSDSVIQGWLNSDGHRRNLLDSRYEEVGIATANGQIDGRDTTVVVAMYAAPQPLQLRFAENPTENGDTLPATTSYSIGNPLTTLATIPVTTGAAVTVLAALAVVYALQHLVVRRRHLAWERQVHPRPLLQSSVLIGVAVLLLQSSFGVVG